MGTARQAAREAARPPREGRPRKGDRPWHPKPSHYCAGGTTAQPGLSQVRDREGRVTEFPSYLAADDRYDSMEYRRSGRSGLKLPALSLGLWHNFGDDRTLDSQRAILRRAFDLGVTHFDLANNYGPPPGSAELNFGKIFAQDFSAYRDELVISTKAGYLMHPGPYGEWGSRKYLTSSLDASLKRMGVDHVDIFYSHRFDPHTPLEETMGALASRCGRGRRCTWVCRRTRRSRPPRRPGC